MLLVLGYLSTCWDILHSKRFVIICSLCGVAQSCWKNIFFRVTSGSCIISSFMLVCNRFKHTQLGISILFKKMRPNHANLVSSYSTNQSLNYHLTWCLTWRTSCGFISNQNTVFSPFKGAHSLHLLSTAKTTIKEKFGFSLFFRINHKQKGIPLIGSLFRNSWSMHSSYT